MNQSRSTSIPAAVLVALSLVSVARADEPADAKNEIVVFGGISLLDADRSSTASFGDGSFQVPAMRGFGRFGGFNRALPPISFEAETSLGSSAIFGARYSRRIKDRLAVEADLQIAPTHSLELRGGACIAGFCVDGSGRPGSDRGGRALSLGDRNVIAWHYGAGLAYEITGGDVRPFVLLGAGASSWDGARAAETDFALRFGAGLKILFGRVGARVDVVDHLLLDHFVSGETEHDVHVTGGLLVRF